MTAPDEDTANDQDATRGLSAVHRCLQTDTQLVAHVPDDVPTFY